MKQIVVLTVVFLFQIIYSQPKSDFILTPCIGNSILNSKTSENDLIKIVGKKNIERVERWYAEGTERIVGSVFFEDTPQSFFIKWKDTVNFKNPEWIEIHGDKSVWEIDNGIKIGVELKELVKLNSKHFSFSGFDWDYGGYVNFEKGNLESDCYSVTLYYDYKDLFENEWNQIVGDKIISTKNPVLNKIKVYVDSITFYFK
ncbi:MAG TPA: hypothetical protein PKE38_08615 [Ignavibacteriaceae bacterium]|nr:hypothetical protein [Ignavibacterium sp.]HMN24550.1 hypothetical protein [Ignavibacteriaceae bacterium]